MRVLKVNFLYRELRTGESIPKLTYREMEYLVPKLSTEFQEDKNINKIMDSV